MKHARHVKHHVFSEKLHREYPFVVGMFGNSMANDKDVLQAKLTLMDVLRGKLFEVMNISNKQFCQLPIKELLTPGVIEFLNEYAGDIAWLNERIMSGDAESELQWLVDYYGFFRH